ncbi:C-X-C motif chemokine 17 [Chionomys nivalis]|uniref:C-X-C motif chemokine 17 n=1 Tax=Chionomys nivalis TaxID=269649 RepID=UPI002592A752|nr:C-X-C motif chemokine 17 [Chionomys nivalis]
MKVLVSAFLLLLPAILTVSSRPNPGVAKSHGDQRQVSGRWLQEGGQECECRDWFLRAPKRKSTRVLESSKKQCPCDHVKDSEKKNRHQKHHRKPKRPSKTCQQFLKRCQLASFSLPL